MNAGRPATKQKYIWNDAAFMKNGFYVTFMTDDFISFIPKPTSHLYIQNCASSQPSSDLCRTNK